ncbi:MAG: hypothetical protein RBU37_08105 [Myxococcota bacterium]|nr:hypothetical protein [Myxococcota bacterium]
MPNRQKLGGTGQVPNRQKLGGTGQVPNRQKTGGTGQVPNRQKLFTRITLCPRSSVCAPTTSHHLRERLGVDSES